PRPRPPPPQGDASSPSAAPPARHGPVGGFSGFSLLEYCTTMGRPGTAGGRGHPPELGRRELLVGAGRAAVAAFAGEPLLLAATRLRPARAGTRIDALRRAVAAAGGTVPTPCRARLALAP